MRTIGMPDPERNGFGDGSGPGTQGGGKYPAPVRTALILGTCALGWSATIATVQYLW